MSPLADEASSSNEHEWGAFAGNDSPAFPAPSTRRHALPEAGPISGWFPRIELN